MSTSRSDKPPVPAPGTGIGSVFQRAVREQRDKPAPAAVEAGVELKKCDNCGGARQSEALVCVFCGADL